MPRHYLAVLVPMADRTWRAYLPDFPTCEVDGRLAELSLAGARDSLSHVVGQLVAQGIALPTRRSYEAIRSHSAWAAERGIDWDSALICVVDVKIDASTVSTMGHATVDVRIATAGETPMKFQRPVGPISAAS